jgi:cytochrome c oxidase cbb3-type subunit 3
MENRNPFAKKSIYIATVFALALAVAVTAQEPPAAPAGAATPATGGGGRGGRGGRNGRGAAGASGAPGRAGGGRRGAFPQYTRELASQDVIFRGKSLYDASCASCHATDLRGVLGKGANVLRSQVVYGDEHGEALAAELAKHTPALTLATVDVAAISEYLHSIQATMGAQGSPPGRNPVGIELNVLTGNPAAGKAYFDAHCASCHSITGDMKGIGAKYADDPRALQSAWLTGSAGGGGRGGGGRGGRGGGGGQGTVTTADGQKFQGRILKHTDFLVSMVTADGVRHDWARDANGLPKVDIPDPQAAHKKMALELDDPENKNLHDVTAYLATLK